MQKQNLELKMLKKTHGLQLWLKMAKKSKLMDQHDGMPK